MFYNTCQSCGSNNDPGEVCECQRRDFQRRPAETRESKQAATAERRAEGVRNGKHF